MSKLVIQTQYCENYAKFYNEDYVHGVSEPYWKFKGGSTYVMENLSSQTINALASGNFLWDKIQSDIEYANEASKEYILDWSIEEDDASVCECGRTLSSSIWLVIDYSVLKLFLTVSMVT